jgi:hypothetical protein
MKTIKSSRVLKRVVAALFTGFLIIVLILLTVRLDNPSGCIAGYILGLFAVVLHFFQVNFFARLENARFFSFYGLATLARISTILGLFVALILLEKIDQFSFTVSFLISYIYHSVIDIYLIKDD